MSAGRDRVKQLKGALLFIGILILGGVLVVFVLRRQKPLPDQTVSVSEKENTTIAVDGVHYTGIQNGVTEWLLDAESANYQQEKSSVYLSMLKATFYDADGESVLLSAESGVWNRDSNDLEVSGHVVLKNSQVEMYTETLTYTSSTRMFVTHSPVTIHGYLMDPTADEGMSYSADGGMSYSLDTGHIDFYPPVKVIFTET